MLNNRPATSGSRDDPIEINKHLNQLKSEMCRKTGNGFEMI